VINEASKPPAEQPPAPSAPPDPPAPTETEETVPTVTPAVEPSESNDSQGKPAGVSISALERRLSLLRPYGIPATPATLSAQTAPAGTVNT